MENDIVLLISVVSSAIFVIQFILSFIINVELDTDVDIDTDIDNLSMSLSDIISFKGLIHFLIGYGWATYFTGNHVIGIVSGAFFFIVLFYVYKLTYKLKQEIIYECPEDLDGREAEAEKIRRQADAEAAAYMAKARAEAEAIKLKLEAEAEGKKKSLMAEAEGFQAMVKAAESNPAIAIQYKMVDQWKEIAGEQVKAFEHINLGNVTVFDGGNGSTGNFLNNMIKTVAPALGVIDQLPLAETFKKIKGSTDVEK